MPQFDVYSNPSRTSKEALSIIGPMKPIYKLMFSLLYGSDLRKAELLKLRVKDIDFEATMVFVYRSNGGKDRTTMLPKKLIEPLKNQMRTTVRFSDAEYQ
ncbi:tyrosine-type recombinase/integrase [Glaciecola sp.]|nr:tyrosine-type recombinase/integrase [Glaciecola sp.]